MNRPERAMSEQDALAVLKSSEYGVLSTCSVEGIPYGVPVNYYYSQEENAIYFHCANNGRKLDNITANNLVSFVVVGSQIIIPERYTTHYDSAIVAGRARIIDHEQEKKSILIQLCEVLTPSAIERRDEVIQKYFNAVTIVKIDIDSVTGKRNRDI